MPSNKNNPYLFSDNEIAILKSLRTNNTPLKIHRDTNIPRPTIYFTLNRLKLRGLVKEKKLGKRNVWILENTHQKIESETKKDESINIYNSPDSIVDFLYNFITKSKQRFKFFNGDHNVKYWSKYIKTKDVVTLNNSIRDNSLVSEVISSNIFLKENERLLGKEWSKSFTDKPTEYHLLDNKYTNFNSQILLREEKVFFINMSKPIVIEISDPEIHKCISSMFDFIKDNTRKLNLSDVLK